MNNHLNTNFHRSGSYADLIRPRSMLVRESSDEDRPFLYTERHLHCIWSDAAYRPALLKSADGEEIAVEDPGRWNLEAGPDFLDAVLSIGPEKRKIKGDVEIHVYPKDWHTHGHAGDHRYDQVAAHVTFFPGRPDLHQLQQPAVHIPLRDALKSQPGFSFESIDVTAYPYAAIPASTLPCADILNTWSPPDLIRLLNSAGEERLRLKTIRIKAAMTEHGRDQVLFTEIMAALGYKHNRNALRQLAQQLPLRTLREKAGNNAVRAYALLLGVSGLIPTRTSARWDPETRTFVRNLWDYWWKRQSELEHCIMPRSAWRLSGVRPQNHPVRRIAAGAALFSRPTSLVTGISALKTEEPETWLKQAASALQENTAFPYWHRRLSLGGKPQHSDIALLGTRRVSAVVTNVLIPYMAALDIDVTSLLDVLPPEQDNCLIRQTAFTLFGRDHNPAFYRHGLRQQGLIQIFHDFCLNKRSTCSQCRLPPALKSAR